MTVWLSTPGSKWLLDDTQWGNQVTAQVTPYDCFLAYCFPYWQQEELWEKKHLTHIIFTSFTWAFTACSYSDSYHSQNSNYYPLKNYFRAQSWHRLSRKISSLIYIDAQATATVVIRELQSLHSYSIPPLKSF